MFIVISVLHTQNKHVEAVADFISVEAFAKALAIELDLDPVKGSNNSDYVNALLETGIIDKGEISNYKSNLVRADAMVFLNRADQYLNGDNLNADLVQLAIDKRISDISTVKASKRSDIAKAYVKGFLKGYSNGAYSTHRNLKLKSRITKSAALDCIKMLKDESKRAKISPDGQLIRTTNLPKYAKYYPYILASFPNSYYDWKFTYEDIKAWDENGNPYKLKNLIDYAAPVDVTKVEKYNIKVNKELYLNIWVEKVRSYMEHTFNVDYRDIGDKWIDEVASTHFYYNTYTYEPSLRRDLKKYVEYVKEYKTRIEYDTIAVDGSTLYFYNGKYYLRTYVKYRIVSTDIKSEMDTNTLARYQWHNRLLFSGDWVDIRGFKKGVWREGHYDISLSDMETADGTNLRVANALYMDGYYKYRKVE